MFTLFCKKRFTSLLALSFFSFPAFSACGHIYVGTSLGASFALLGKHTPQISYDDNLLMDAYPLNNRRGAAPIISINGGYEFLGDNWKPAVALGLGLYSNPTDYDYHGQLIETALGDPSSTLYNYNYNINTTRLMAEIQLTWMLGKLAPFINFGAGPTWNKMDGYTETAITSTGYPALPPFRSHTNVNFAYQAGFGVSTAFNFPVCHSDTTHERISVGYRYANLGTTAFGTRGSPYPFSLKTGLLKSNDIYLSYTHLF